MSDSKKYTRDKFRAVIYANRVPKPLEPGGLVQVVKGLAGKITHCIGPRRVTDERWDELAITLDGDQKDEDIYELAFSSARTQIMPVDLSEGVDIDYKIAEFRVPETFIQRQYIEIANEIIWPVMHSEQPKTSLDLDKIEDSYRRGMLLQNELATMALRRLIKEEEYDINNPVWVHDYQCPNVPGMIYTHHTPWPELSHLRQVNFMSEDAQAAKVRAKVYEPAGKGLVNDASIHDINILDTIFFRDYVESLSDRAIVTFHRMQDQVNFLMTVAAMSVINPDIATYGDDFAGLGREHTPEQYALVVYTKDGLPDPRFENICRDIKDPDKYEEIKAALTEAVEFGGALPVSLFGSRVTVMNVPVGNIQKDIMEEAKLGLEKLPNYQLDRLTQDALLPEGVTLQKDSTNSEGSYAPISIAEINEKLGDRDRILSSHRLDYTKGMLTKLQAIKELYDEDPEMAKRTTGLFVLQTTRKGVSGYTEHAEEVFKLAREIREVHGDDSLVILAIDDAGLPHDILMGLMRHEKTRAFMGLGFRDGHDLSVREFVDVNDPGSAKGNIVSSGAGAADVLGTRGDPSVDAGAYIINNPRDHLEVKAALKEILDKNNEAELSRRFDAMRQRSGSYDGLNFGDKIADAYEPAMVHRFGENWQDIHYLPESPLIDRKGGLVSELAGDILPDTIIDMLTGTVRSLTGRLNSPGIGA